MQRPEDNNAVNELFTHFIHYKMVKNRSNKQNLELNHYVLSMEQTLKTLNNKLAMVLEIKVKEGEGRGRDSEVSTL